MKRVLLIVSLLGAAIAAGVISGEFLCRTESGRKAALKSAEWTGIVDASAAQALVRQEQLRNLSRTESVAADEIDLSINSLRDQFPDENAFTQTLNSSGLTLEALRAELTEHGRALHWIEWQIAPELKVDSAAVRRFYDENQPRFAQPQRYRASHIFRAAPDGYPEEVVAAKQSDIQGLSVRILAGEKFEDLAAEASEDEASKSRGGDLGYFSAWRMPPEFIAEVEKMHPDEISAPIRSHLGFHIVKLTEVKPARQMSFEEVQSEIASMLANEKRMAAVARLTERLDAQ